MVHSLGISSYLRMGYLQFEVGGKMQMFYYLISIANIHIYHCELLLGRDALNSPLPNTESLTHFAVQ